MTVWPLALGLGSNVGDKAGTIREAARRLGALGLVQGGELSPLYRTEPWGPVPQDWYANACLAGTTTLSPLDLLAEVKALEAAMGRVVTVRWGPRVIDIDLLYYDGLAIDAPTLTLPHRDLVARAFVLVPLADIRPDVLLAGRSVAAHRADLDTAGVVRLQTAP